MRVRGRFNRGKLAAGFFGAVLFALCAAPAARAGYFHAPSDPSVTFDDPISACVHDFEVTYLPWYSDHVLRRVIPRIGDNYIFVGTDCVFFHPVHVPVNLHGYSTLSCPSGSERLAAAPWCRPLDDPASGDPPDQCPSRPEHKRGNPIDVASGEKIQRSLDFSTADGRLYFARTYSSEYRFTSPLGMGWVSNFDRFFSKPPASLSIHIFLGDGRVARFNSFNDGVWRPAIPKTFGTWTESWMATPSNYRRDVAWRLEAVGSGWRFTDENGQVENYDSNLRITSIQFPGNYTWTYTYNTAGQYTSVTDSLGRSIQLTYLANGLLDTVTAPDGTRRSYAYDQNLYFNAALGAADYLSMHARLVKVVHPDTTPLTDADNPTTTYLYEDPGLPNALTGVIDERGIRIRTWAYDSSGRGMSSASAGGLDPYGLSYNKAAHTTTVTNPLGLVEVFTAPVSSQSMRRYTQISSAATAHAAAATTTYGYDANNYLNRITDPEGRVTTFVRDARGLVTSRTEGSGTPQARTVTAAWHPSYRLPTQIVEPGLTTNLTYNSNGNLTQLQRLDTTAQTVPYSTNGQQRIWIFTYTAAGLLDTVDGPLAGSGDLTDFDYDTQGNLIRVTDAMGHVTTVTAVDGAGRPLSVTAPDGVVTALTYTPRGWVSSLTVNPGPGERQWSFAYDGAGHVTQVTLPSGGTLLYTYDNAGRLTQVRNHFDERMELSYNTAGQVIHREYKTSGGTTLRASLSFTYDEVGRLLQTIGAAAETETRSYDRNDHLTTVTDPRSAIWGFGYDSLSRLTSATNPELQPVQYQYDGRSKLSRQTDGRGLQTSFVRNGFGDVILETSPERGSTTYWYDAAGKVTAMIDAEGVETDFSYDNNYRLTAKTFPGDPALDQAFTYDDTTAGNHGTGHVTGASDRWGARDFVYDEAGLLARETRTINGHNYEIDFSYSPNGGVESITYPSGRQVRYVRDVQDRITAVDTRPSALSGWSSVASGVAWRPFGPLESLNYGNGLRLAIDYDQNYWLTHITVTGGPTATLDLAFGRDAAGAVTSVTDAVNPARSVTYTYRPSGRLQSSTSGALTTSWTYDAAGNRTRETRAAGTTTYDEYIYPLTSNRLTEVRDPGGVLLRGFVYRQNGQTSEDNRAGTGLFEYEYDANGRMSEVSRNGSVIASYGYDGASRRITRDVAGAPHVSREYLYLPDGRLLAEADGTGAIVREYVWLEELPLAAVDVSGGGATVYYIHAGHRGEPLAMTDGAKAKAWDAGLSPFGAATIFTATTPLDLRLPGQQLQAETGLHQNWLRDYDPTLGRYAQPDPIGLAGGPNVYSYVGQDPLNSVDPDGENPMIIGALIGGGLDLGGQVLEGLTSPSGQVHINWGRVGVAAAFGAVGGPLGEYIGEAALSVGARFGLTAFVNSGLGTMHGMFDVIVDPCLRKEAGEHILSSTLEGAVSGVFGLHVSSGPGRRIIAAGNGSRFSRALAQFVGDLTGDLAGGVVVGGGEQMVSRP
jgi:RHS repeat-associated protein